MLTHVILDGQMGKQFGRDWHLDVHSPAEAVAMIEANKPGFRAWIRSNLKDYTHYTVTVKYESGNESELDASEYEQFAPRKILEIRFVPLISGASSGKGKIIAGVVLIVVGAILNYYTGSDWGLYKAGAGLILGGAIQLLTAKKTDDKQTEEAKSSLFDGPENTTQQGVPVQLIYGRKVLVGSHVISARLSVDEQPI